MSDELREETPSKIPSKTGNSAEVGYGKPPAEHRFKPGNPGGPGRPTAGWTVREAINQLIFNGVCEDELRRIARARRTKTADRIAAQLILRALEYGDMADFCPLLSGEKTLAELRDAGVDTHVLKKVKMKVRRTASGTEFVEGAIELHDRSGKALDALIGHTELTVAEVEKQRRLDEGNSPEQVSWQAPIQYILPLPPHLQARVKELPPPRKL